MKIRNLANLAGALALGIAMLAIPRARTQPLNDRVLVDMPYTTVIGEKTLQPGKYEIKRQDSSSGSRVMLFYSDNGMKFETSAMAIPAYDPNTARETRIVLTRVGDDYYYNKIWVEGKQYGYEFPLPKAAREREKELRAAVNVPATTTKTAETAAAPAVQAGEPEPAPEVAANQPSVEAEPEAPAQEPAEVTPEPEPPQAQPAPAPATAPAFDPNRANREMDQNPPPAEQLPATSAGWATMLLAGTGLLAAGLKLRR